MTFPQFAMPKEAIEPAVDKEIENFDQFFQSELKNEPLLKSEKALLKTYLFWKTRSE